MTIVDPDELVVPDDLTDEDSPDIAHLVCTRSVATRRAYCGADLDGSGDDHYCPPDLSCGCVLCGACRRVHDQFDQRGDSRCPVDGRSCGHDASCAFLPRDPA